MRTTRLCLIAILFSVNAFAQQAKMTLKQCVETAINNNITVQQSGLRAEAAEINLKQAKSNLLPDLNGSFGYGLNQGRNVDPLTNSYINQQLTSSNVGLSSGVILFNGMRLQNLIKQNSLGYDAAKMDLQQSKDNLALNVILAYLQVLSNEDILVVNKAQAETTKKQVERMGVLVKEGAAANYLLSDLKGQLANEEIAIINSSNALQQSKLNLCQLMNVDYNATLELERNESALTVTKYSLAPADVYNTSLQQLALVKAGEFRIKSFEKAVKVAQGGFYPVVGLQGNLYSSYSSLAETLTPTTITESQTGSYVIINGNQNPVLRQQQNFSSAKTGYGTQLNNNLGTFVGINMQVPLFNNFQSRNRVKLAKLDLKNSVLEFSNTKLQLKQNIEQAHLNMTASYDRYKILLEQVKNFEESFRAAEVRFENGVINSAEYLISKNNLDRTKINLTQAKYDYIFRTRLLDYFQGVLSF
jgi:outer membrane protein